MKRIDRNRAGILGLVILAMGQVLAWGFLGQPSKTSLGSQWLQQGDDLSGILPTDEAGREVSLATGSPLVLLVFDSQCGHCLEISHLWKAWTGEKRPGFRMVAISSEISGPAVDFATGQEWNTEVWTVSPTGLGGGPRLLTRRVPWAFLLDGDGVILAEGHGRLVEEIVAGYLENSMAVLQP